MAIANKMNTKQIKINDYDYELPDERIAKFPLPRRDHSKLLLYRHGVVGESLFYKLPEFIPAGSLMIFNNTRVIQARLHFNKDTGARIEIFCLEPAIPCDYALIFQTTGRCSWYCLVGNSHRWKEGKLSRTVEVKGQTVTFTAERKEAHVNGNRIEFEWDGKDVTFADLQEAVGEIPIPPYLNRKSEESDKESYQTVYSRIKGSVAAPTAGLHFTPEVLAALREKGIDCEDVTLHVGAGTFKPVKSEEIADHEMHNEFFAVKRAVLEKLRDKGEAIAVGTTSVRTLESLYYVGEILKAQGDPVNGEIHVPQWAPYEGEHTLSLHDSLQVIIDYLDRNGLETLHAGTQIIIAPGYEYRVVKAMLTNFHQPKSTLLLLVSAFVKGDWHTIYDYALSHDFRFLSYGDSSLLVP